MTSSVNWVGTVAALLCASGCTVLPLFYSVFDSKSPDGKSEVSVTRNYPGSDAEYRFKINLRTYEGTRTIHFQDRGSALGLIEAYWTANSKDVAILVCNWGQPLMFANNAQTGTPLDTAQFRPFLERQLRQKYGTFGGNAIDWACSSNGRSAFHQLNRR